MIVFWDMAHYLESRVVGDYLLDLDKSKGLDEIRSQFKNG